MSSFFTPQSTVPALLTNNVKYIHMWCIA